MIEISNAKIHTIDPPLRVTFPCERAGALELNDSHRSFGCSVRVASVPASADTG